MARIMKATYIALLFTCIVAVSTAAWSADNLSKTGRLIASKNSKAIVTIQLVIEESASYGGQTEKSESKMSATGTIIDPSGMVVTSLMQIDPRAMMEDLEEMDFKLSIKVTDAFIRLEDGTEIQMDVVVRDRDLNLAFLKPKEPLKKSLTYVNLKNGSTPLALDRVLTMYRLGQVAGRSVASEYDDVISVVKKPRKFFVISNSWAQGGPAFTTDGKAAGIVVRKTNIKGALRRSGSAEALTIIMPSETVLQAAVQAKKPKK